MPYSTASSTPINVWPLYVHQRRIVEQRPDQMAGQFRGLRIGQRVAELVRLGRNEFFNHSVSRMPIQIDTAATPNFRKSTAMSAAIVSIPALCTPYAGPKT